MKCKTCGTDHRGVAKHGGYCLDHQELRAEAAEVAAAESAAFARGLQNELKAAEARIQELKAQLESITTVDLHNAMQQRDELLQEARNSATLIMALRQERDELRAELNTVNMLRTGSEAACDELRRQLTEAQHAIDVLSQTVVAQNNEIKRLSQQREDVEQYRAEIEQARHEIERLNRFLQTVVNIGDKDHHAAFDGERWRQMRHCANQGLNTKNEMYEP